MVTVIGVRHAQPFDIPRMEALLERRFLQYEEYRPGFWRKTWDAEMHSRPSLELLLHGGVRTVALVHDQDGAISGFIIGTLEPNSPAVDAGDPVSPAGDARGWTCLVDDFVLASPDLWNTVGVELINAMTRQARARGAVRIVVVCDHLDRLKRTMLALYGYSSTSEWYVKPITP